MTKLNSKNRSTTRRSFIKQTAIATSALIVPRHVLGGVGFTAPSDQLVLAAIGAGGKGIGDIYNASVGGRERVVALCDVDFSGSAKRSVANFPEANRYADYREMLDKETDIDAVTISTPDHSHAHAAVNAMQRGMHVYVQKPLTHNIREARILTEMARSQKVVTQMGNQGGSNPEYKLLQKWIDDRRIGKIHKVEAWTNRPVWPQGIQMQSADASAKPADLDWDLWLNGAPQTDYLPNMHPFNWRGWWDYGTGALGDMGCHIMDVPFRVLGLRYPTDAQASVGTIYSRMWNADYYPEGCPASSLVTLHFEATKKTKSDITMTWSDGGIRPSHPDIIPPESHIGGPGSYNGVLIHGSKGIISTDINTSTPFNLKLYLNNGDTEFGNTKEIKMPPEYNHQRMWVDACKAGFNSTEHQALTSSFDYAGPMTETVLMGNLAIRSYMLRRENSKGAMDYYGRKKLLWDGENMRITNLEEANQFVGRQYREGWEV